MSVDEAIAPRDDLGFCVKCGTRMTGLYCAKDGWGPQEAAFEQSPRGGESVVFPSSKGKKSPIQSQSTKGANSPISMGWYSPITTGSNSPITSHNHYGNSEDQPADVERFNKKPGRKRWQLLVIALVAFAANIASVTGFNLGSIDYTGLVGAFWDMRPIGGEAPTGEFAKLLVFPIALAVFMATLWLWMRPLSLLIVLRNGNFIYKSSKRIQEMLGGRVTSSELRGRCPRCQTGTISLRRVEVAREKVKSTSSVDGKEREVDRAVKKHRLVCDKNPEDHRFKFDPTRVTK